MVENMRDFFLYETQLPAGSGFELFGICHLGWLLGIALFTGATAYWYRQQDGDRQRTIHHVMGILFPGIAMYRDAVLILTGYFDTGYLPFHLCAMALWIAAVYGWKDNRFLGVVYVLLCVPGAVGALLFPDWNVYPLWNYMHIHDFISHGLIVAFGIWLVAAKKVVPEWKDFWMPVVFGIVGMILLQDVNHILHTNYWFLNQPSAGSPLVWILNLTGSHWYIPGYFLFCMVIVALWQSLLSLFRHF